MPKVEYLYIADASQVISANEKVASSSRAAQVAMDGEAASGNAAAASGTATAAAMGDLASQKAALLAQTKNVEAAIRGETRVLGDAQNSVKQLGAGHKALDAAVVDSQAKLAGYIQEHEGLKIKLGEVTTQMRAATVVTEQKVVADEEAKVSALEAARAEQAKAIANVEGAAAADLNARQMIVTAAAAGKVTGAAIPGARAIGVLAGAFSGMAIPQLAVIIGLGILVGELFKLGKAKEEQIALDEAGLKIDAERTTAMHTGTLFTKERATVMHDFTASNVALGLALADLTKKEKAEDEARRAATEGEVNYKTAASEVYLMNQLLGQTTEQLTKKEGEATAARVTATAAVQKEVEAYIKFGLEMRLSADAILEMARRTGAEIEVINALTAALDTATFATLRFKSGQNVISETRFKVAHDAAAVGQTLKHAEAERRFTDAIAAQGDETVKLARETELTEKNLKAFTETHRQGGAAARATANELVNLRKQAQDALAALNQDNFAARDAKINNDIQAERDHLKINKRDKEEALQYLAVREQALHDKVAQDRAVAEQRLIDEIRAIEIAGIVDVYDREVEALKLKSQQKALAIQQEFGATDQSEQLLLRMKQAYADEFARWFIDRNRKAFEQLTTEGGRFENQLNAERAKEDSVFFKESLKDWELHEKQIQALIDKFGQKSGGHVSVLDVNQVDRINSRLNALGLSVKAVDERFGHATSNIHVFELRLKALEKYNKGDFFGGLRASVQAVALDFLESGRAAEAMANVIEDSFSAGIAAGGNFVSAFGAALVSGMANIVAQVLGQIGIMLISRGVADVLMGLAINADPFTFGAGTALIAAGHAEILQGAAFSALAGIAKGLGSLASSAIKGDGGGSAASGAASTGASGGSASGQTPQRPQPTVINLPTTPAPPKQGPISITLRLDRNVAKDFIHGEQILTRTNIRGQHFQAVSAVVKKVKK
jgi:hypothetical protein